MSVIDVLEIFLTLSLILITSALAYWYYLKNFNYWSDKNIPFETPIPILGTLSLMLKGKAFHDVDQYLYKKHGKLFGTYAGNLPAIYISDPEHVKSVLVKDFNVFTTRRVFATGHHVMDNILSILVGDKWRNVRNTITPAFSTGKIKNMMPIISDCASISTSNFRKYAASGEVVDCKKLFGNYTLDVIANVAYGTRLDSHNDPDNKFVAHASKMFSTELSLAAIISFLFPRIGRLLGVTFFPVDTLEFFENITKTIVERRENNKEERRDFLQLMIDSMKETTGEQTTDDDNPGTKADSKPQLSKVDEIKRKPLTRDEAVAQCVLFFIAGYDSTASTLTFISYYLALNSEVQNKLLKEVDLIWKNRTVLDSEALFEAKYLEAVIEESLRISPPGTRLERTAGADYVLGDTGLTIPKGMVVEIPVYAIHHDPEYFPDPEKFKPERFLPKDNNEVRPYTYLPFGSGPRGCIAMRLAMVEVKICLLHVLRWVRFSKCAKTTVPMTYLKATPLLQPKDVFLGVTSREK